MTLSVSSLSLMNSSTSNWMRPAPRYKLKYFEIQAGRILNMDKTKVRRRSDNLKELLVYLCDQYGVATGVGNSKISRNSEGSVGDITSSSKRNGNIKMTYTRKKKAMIEDWDKQLEEGEDLVVGHEVDIYLLDPIEKPKTGSKFKILQWWSHNGSKYPSLKAISKDTLAI